METRSHTTRSRWSRNWVTLTAIALVISLDQLSKLLVRNYMVPGHSLLAWSPVQLTYIMNTGSAFGLFPRQTLFLIIAAFVGIIALYAYYRNYDNPPLMVRICLGMMIGGAIGNLIDRVRFGSVVDFIDARFWPVFNLADSSITVGILILVWVLLTSREKKKSAAILPEGRTIHPVLSTDDSTDKPDPQAGS